MVRASLPRRVAPLEDAPATHEALRPAVPSHPLPHMGACILATSVVCPEERMSADRLLQHVMARSQDALGRGGAAKMRFQLQGLLQYVKVTCPLSPAGPVNSRLLSCERTGPPAVREGVTCPLPPAGPVYSRPLSRESTAIAQ